MLVLIRTFIVLSSWRLLHAQTASSDPAGVLGQFAVARIAGIGSESIAAMTSDAAGNVYIAGATSSPDFPVKNAAQPAIGGGHLMRSTDRGQTWQSMGSPLVVPLEIAPHPSDPQTLLLGATDGIYKTVDGGQTWRHVYSWPPAATSAMQLNLAIDAANARLVYLYVADTQAAHFLASADGGDTWQVRTATSSGISPSGTNAKLLWIDPRGSGTIVFGLALSRDHGVTWTRMPAPPAGFLTLIAPDPQHDGGVYAITANGTTSHFYAGTGWGANWTEKTALSGDIASIVGDPGLPDTLYATVGGTLYTSSDGATTWNKTAASETAAFNLAGFIVLPSRQCMAGATVAAPQLTNIQSVATGPGCNTYAVRTVKPDAFVAKLATDGKVLWSTFLGGSDTDAAAAIALDASGNVYIAGNTASSDFPATAPRIGILGQQNGFCAKLDPNGKLLYSNLFGGDLKDTISALVVSADGNAHVVGTTDSRSFPTTSGAFQTEHGALFQNGFVVKLASDGQVVYASYLPYVSTQISDNGQPLLSLPVAGIAIVLEASGSALIGGQGATLSRVSADGSTLTSVSKMPGPIYSLDADSQGNIYAAGQTGALPSGSVSCFYGFVYHHAAYVPAGDIFVVKLEPDTLRQVYLARLSGSCLSLPGAIKVGASGEVNLGIWSYGSFPLRNPVLATGTGHVIARLSADGTSVLFSTYVGMVNAPYQGFGLPFFPPVTSGVDGSLFASVTTQESYQSGTHAAVLQLPVLPAQGISVNAIYDAFTGAGGQVEPATLLTIRGQSLSTDFIDLGLNYPSTLPALLGGVQVLFDGLPAEMFQVASDHLICVAPAAVKDKTWTTVQIVKGVDRSTPFVVRASAVPSSGLLTPSFPAPPPTNADGTIRNADGTLNDSGHPAAPGSTVTLFATGLSGPGEVAIYWAPRPYAPNPYGFPVAAHPGPVSGIAGSMPGFIPYLYSVKFKVPDRLGPAVDYLPTPGVVTRVPIDLGSSEVGIYVK